VVKKLKKTKVIELNEAYQKILIWFFSFPDREMSLNDLSESLRISKTTANMVVTQLVGAGFLFKEVIGRIWRISCNKNHIYNYSRKMSYNIMMVYESGIIEEIHDIIENPRAIVLFGSYRKGDDTEESDIDIAVELLGNEEPKIQELGVIPQFGYRKDVTVNLHIFSRNKIDLNLFSNIANGIVLEGFLEVRP
jgi:predicted nucleotidyltransferase